LGRDFGVRLASALVLFACALLVVWQGGWTLSAFIAIACALMCIEWERMTQSPFSWAGVLLSAGTIALAVLLATQARYDLALAAVAVGVTLAFLHAQAMKRHRRWAIALPLYLGLPAVALVWVRDTPEGWLPLLWFLFVVWATDSWAMIAGRLFKGPLLAPRISPKKTWSGFWGGIIGAVGIGSVFAAVAGWRITPTLIAVMIAISLVGQAGDVLESAVKRRFKTKDAGDVIPGHGGVLDRVDSLLAAALLYAAIRMIMPLIPAGGTP
jgi:phosphatidate cytidylyltransferase